MANFADFHRNNGAFVQIKPCAFIEVSVPRKVLIVKISSEFRRSGEITENLCKKNRTFKNIFPKERLSFGKKIMNFADLQ